MEAHRSVDEPKPPEDPDSPLSFSMEGFQGQPPSPLIPFFWAPGWNSHQQAMNKYQREVGGALRGGDPGARLFEASGQGLSYFDRIPRPFSQEAGEYLAVPLYHIFGSEELSRHAPALAERAPAPYVALCSEDADSIGAASGDLLELRLGEAELRLPVRMMPSLVRGLVGLPAGLTGLEGIRLPARAGLSKPMERR